MSTPQSNVIDNVPAAVLQRDRPARVPRVTLIQPRGEWLEAMARRVSRLPNND
jgi:hypothetical protein